MANIKPRKRQLESDDENEERDDFDTDNSSAPRRGRKECRRVSGVYREIKALESIGKDASVMRLVFDKLPLKSVMESGVVSCAWYITACLILRRRYGRSPILRLWNSTKPSQYLWCNWELHFHEQLLDGSEPEDEPMEGGNQGQNSDNFPSIGTIISVGSRSSFEQFVHEDAKLPFRQEFIFMTCSDAIVTLPDFAYTGEIDPIFGWNNLVVQSLFLPKSEHFTVKAFGLEMSKDEWKPDDVKSKLELPKEDTGVDQELQAVLCIQYSENDATKSFINSFEKAYKNVSFLAGYGEEIGSNRIADSENPLVVGISIYTGRGAMASVYEVEFEDDTTEIMKKIEEEASSRPYGFCFVFSNDDRDCIVIKDEDDDEFGNWDQSVRPASRVAEICQELRKTMPRTPIIGIKSMPSVLAKTVDKTNSNAQGVKKLCYGILLLSYN